MGDMNRMLRLAQSTGGSPYDEEQYMPAPNSSSLNLMLNNRMSRNTSPIMQQYMTRERGGPPPAGSDTDMIQMYGPEDQVAYDAEGNPIPLADPRHPMNQRGQMSSGAAPMYPQRR